MVLSAGGALPSGQESLVVSALFLVVVAMGLWFWGSTLLRWAYALRQIPNQFRQGRTDARESTDEERET